MSTTARSIVSLARPKRTSSILPVDAPLSLLTLQRISEALASNAKPTPCQSRVTSQPQSPASVLLPLFNVNDKPAILFQVRASRMSAHSGEVSFPGGKFEEEDASLEYTAKRETYEEIGTPLSNIHIIAPFGPLERSLSGRLVHPFAGYLSPSPIPQPTTPSEEASTTALPNLNLSLLSTNPSEVALLFHLTLEELTNEKRLDQHHFRGHPPYWCVNVSDKVAEEYWTTPRRLPTEVAGDEEAIDRGKRLEIWGLTAYYLNQFMRGVGLW
ncbi:hypothetical protein M408DRAFT_326600 [Serendipita vermifera MAFF 305830]|uniref:Nudix hydrolase domain-containing protein n=1 Tax=Serendipita vermifera MAFF 305830 TaxID=933852 RepID=A0A0C2XVG9_SERVB|nr:hypothetical protein M408DRAFT_326600 [Serendipita vermifera MAFF 305830]